MKATKTKCYKLYKMLLNREDWRPPTFEFLVEKLGYSGNKGLIASLKALEKKGLVYKKGNYYYPIIDNSMDAEITEVILKRQQIFNGTNN